MIKILFSLVLSSILLVNVSIAQDKYQCKNSEQCIKQTEIKVKTLNIEPTKYKQPVKTKYRRPIRGRWFGIFFPPME